MLMSVNWLNRLRWHPYRCTTTTIRPISSCSVLIIKNRRSPPRLRSMPRVKPVNCSRASRWLCAVVPIYSTHQAVAACMRGMWSTISIVSRAMSISILLAAMTSSPWAMPSVRWMRTPSNGCKWAKPLKSTSIKSWNSTKKWPLERPQATMLRLSKPMVSKCCHSFLSIKWPITAATMQMAPWYRVNLPCGLRMNLKRNFVSPSIGCCTPSYGSRMLPVSRLSMNRR